MNKFVLNKVCVYKGRSGHVMLWNCCLSPKEPQRVGWFEKNDICIVAKESYHCKIHPHDRFCIDLLHPVHGLITLHGAHDGITYGDWHLNLAVLR